MILAGRGWGKTHTGAMNTLAWAAVNKETITAVVAPTGSDLRRVCFGGPSGMLALLPEELYWGGSRRKGYNHSTFELRLFNGSLIQGFFAIEPDRMRGPQYHRAWCDELAAWRYPEAWDQLQFGLRLGDNPQTIITTTPRPTPIIRGLLKRDGDDVAVTTGSTFENEDNLAPAALQSLKDKYEGTRLGRQELYAEVLDDVEGALWSRNMLDKGRKENYPEMRRTVVSIDPSATKGAESDEVGIIVAGLGVDGHCYIFEDLSDRMTPHETCVAAVNAMILWGADRIVAEANNGGDWIEMGLRQVSKNVSYKKLHASRGKQARAEPVVALYEQKRVHHTSFFTTMEDELCSWEPNTGMASPNRLDALVWAVTELMLTGAGMKMLHVRA
jgi:phage terminase large subunit-like protein